MLLNDQEQNKKDNIKSLFTNPRTRGIIFVTGCIVLAMISLAFLGSPAETQSKSPIDGKASVNVPVSVTAVPGTSDSADYNKLQEEANQKALEEAKRSGSTFIPVPTATGTVNNGVVTIPSDQFIPPTQPVAQQPQIVQTQVQAQPQVTNLTATPAPVASDKVMEQISGYLSLWGPQNNAEQEFSYARAKLEQKSSAQESSSQSKSGTTSSSQKQGIRYVRSGTMVSARLITPLNSDTPGPVLAEITSGELAGARVIGTMSLNKEALLVKFGDISKPGWPESYSINAVGMDDRFSTALATDVNHHYFKRYSALLGGSFIEAYGKAMSQTGQTIVITDGNVVSDQPDLTPEQIRDSAYGGVLSAAGNEMKKNANVPTTVKVASKDGSVYIKLLFMDDF